MGAKGAYKGIAFHADAFASAKKYDRKNKHDRVGEEVSKAIGLMDSALCPLITAEGSGGDIAWKFKQATGYELAFSEGRMTNRDPKLSAMRRKKYMGQEIDCTMHVKLKDNVRIYFAIVQQLLVICHIGHLPTYTSKVRRGKVRVQF